MFKDNLIMLRSINGYSQEEIAREIGISRQAYAKWENGATVPDIEKCQALARVYGVTMDSLVKNQQTEDGMVVLPGPKGKNIWGTVTMNERGQIVIPKATRDHFDFHAGQRFVLLSDDEEGLALAPSESFERKMNEMMAQSVKKMDE